jgi:hypothetical protein
VLLISDINPTSSSLLRCLLVHYQHSSVRINDIVVGCLVDNVIVGDVNLLRCLLMHNVDQQLLL